MRRGIAMHHAGMLPYAKETVEALFTMGLIKVVFATETLSLGLNMPARACVVSSFTKFNGVSFQGLTSGELAQFMGRAGRRGIDPVGHGIILKEQDVDVRDIYDAALGGEMSVDSKFAPTYTMALNLLGSRTVERAEQLLESETLRSGSPTCAAAPSATRGSPAPSAPSPVTCTPSSRLVRHRPPSSDRAGTTGSRAVAGAARAPTQTLDSGTSSSGAA